MRRLLILAVAGLLSACAQQAPIQLYSGAPQAQSQVLTLVVPGELEIRTINGQSYSAANAGSGLDDKQLLLQPGAYQVQAFYKNGFDVNGGISHEVVRGRTAIFTIDGQAGEEWRLDFKRPQNLQDAKKFEEDFPAWAVNTRTGERKEAEAGNRNISAFSALMGSAEVPSQPTSVAPLGTETAPAAVAELKPTAAPVATLPHNDATLTTLQQMWNLLSPQSREAFLKWVQQ